MLSQRHVIYAILVAVLLATVKSQSTKVRVEVYYETLCPDSIRFLIQQLIPKYADIKDKIDLTLYPFGKAEVWFGESTIFFK